MSQLFQSVVTENKLLRGLIKSPDGTINALTNIEKCINSGVTPGSFTSEFRSWLFTKIKKQFDSNGSAFPEDLGHHGIVKKWKASDSFQDKQALYSKILSSRFDNDEIDVLIREVKDNDDKRVLNQLSGEMIEGLEQLRSAEDFDHRVIISKLESTLEKLNNSNLEKKKVVGNAFDNLDQKFALLQDKRDNPEKYRGISFGIEPLDNATGGSHEGELVVVIGRTGQGKSIALLNFGVAAWRDGANVLYVSVEMPKEQQENRLYSKVTCAEYQKFKDPTRFTDEEMEAVKQKILDEKNSRENEFVIVDASTIRERDIDREADTWEKKTGKKIDLIIVDPLYLCKANEENEDNAGAVSWDLKLLARKRKIPVYAANQINREGHKRHQTGKEMDTMDSSSSDKIGQNCDIMMGIFSDGQGWIKLTLIKYRDGSGEPMFLRRNFDRMSMDYDPEYGGNSAANEMYAISSQKKDDSGLD